MPTIQNAGKVPSRSLLSKFARAGAMKDFLDFLAFRDTAFFFDDFLGDTINLDMYAVAKQGGTADSVFAISVANSSGSGVVSASTGTDDNNATSLVGPIIYKGDQNAGMTVRLKTDIVTGLNLEVGFIDAVPGSSASGTTDVDTPTAAFADGAVLQIDTDQTIATMAFVTKGSTSNQTIKATTLGTFTTPTNAAFWTVTVQLIGNDAICIVNNGVDSVMHTNGTGNNSAGHVEGGIALAPWVYVRTRNTTAKVTDLDYIGVWTDRSTSP